MLANFFKKQKRQLYKNNFLAGLAIFVFSIVLVFLVAADIKVYKKKQALNLQLESLNKQVKEIEQANADLKEKIVNIDNENYIEKVAREDLDLQKPGETVVNFVIPKEEQEAEKQKNKINWLGKLSEFWQWLLE